MKQKTGPVPAKEQPPGELTGGITDDLSKLFRQEIELAMADARRQGRKIVMSSSMYAGAVFAGVLAAILFSLALVYALGTIMPLAWAALIVAIIWTFLGVVLQAEASRKLKKEGPMRQTAKPVNDKAQVLQNPTV